MSYIGTAGLLKVNGSERKHQINKKKLQYIIDYT